MNLITKPAIDFFASAVMSNGKIDDGFNLKEYIKDKYAVLFFYPLNFTFVCPTEIIAFHNRISDFTDRNTLVLGISVDSKFSHLRWRESSPSKGGIGKVNFPLVSDLDKSISSQYNVLHNNGVALRGTFIIDTKFMIRCQMVYDFPLGRNVDECIRVIDEIIYHESSGGKEVCPAGWRKGDPAMEATQEGIEDYLTSHIDNLEKVD